MKRHLFCLVLLCFTTVARAQSYFQQEVDYRIEVELNDIEHRLSGHLELDYRNHSADTLTGIWFHLWPNAYSGAHTPLAQQLYSFGETALEFATEEEKGSIETSAWQVDGLDAQLDSISPSGEMVWLPMAEGLVPGAMVEVSCDFQVKVPSADISRLGHDEQSYQITQWYPKPAVYDRYGWHLMPYLNQGEFYSEFGSFQVDINLPASYIVGATGELKSAEERTRMMSAANGGTYPRFDSNQRKTLRYVQDRVHDFAWFADKEFRILHDTIQLPDTEMPVDAWVLYTSSYEDVWKESMPYVKGAIHHYSHYVGEYPYSQVTVVDGRLSAGGGMEYPMVTVINGTAQPRALERVVVHEIGHNWFYGILGSQEREHPWMDEGMNSYYEELYFHDVYGPELGDVGRPFGFKRWDLQRLGYLFQARRHKDQSLSITSDDYSALNYGLAVYGKGSLVLAQLRAELGDEVFHQAMRTYFDTWAYRHPFPHDFFRVVEQVSGQDMQAFKAHFVDSANKLDIQLKKNREKQWMVIEEDQVLQRMPVRIISGEDTTWQPFERRASVMDMELDEVKAGQRYGSLDIDQRNDKLYDRSLLASWERPLLAFFAATGMRERPSLGIAPLVGRNLNDGIMAGLYLSNIEALPKDFEWHLSPLYSFENERVNGMADMRYRLWLGGESSEERLEFGLNTWRFGLEDIGELDRSYLRLSPSLSYIADMGQRIPHYRELTMRVDRMEFDGPIRGLLDTDPQYYVTFDFLDEKNSGLHARAWNARFEFNEDYWKWEASYDYTKVYDVNEHAFDLRFYAAKMWLRNPYFGQFDLAARPSLHGTDTRQDYRAQHLWTARDIASSQAWQAQQVVRNRGGFTYGNTIIGTSDDWVASVNLNLDVPLPIPLSVYGNAGVYQTGLEGLGMQELYEVGIRWTIMEDIVDVSLPLFVHRDIREFNELQDISVLQTIRFQYALERLAPRKLRDRFEL